VFTSDDDTTMIMFTRNHCDEETIMLTAEASVSYGRSSLLSVSFERTLNIFFIN